MAFQVFPQNAGLTGLLRGAQASATQAGADLTDEERRLLEQRIRAREQLGQRFGPGAQDPSGLAVIGQSQAQQGFADAGQRRVDLAEQAFASEEEQIGLENRRRAALNLANAGLQALANGTPPEQVLGNLERLAPTVGANEQDIEGLRQGFATDPQGTLFELRAALLPQQQGGGPPSVTGQPIQVIGPDGEPALAQQFEDGSTQFITDENGNFIRPARFERGLVSADTVVRRNPEGQLTGQIITGTPTALQEQVRFRQQRLREQQFTADEREAERQRIARLSNVATVADTVTRDANSVLELMDQSGLFQDRETSLGNVGNAIGRGLSSLVPGSTANVIRRELDSVKNNIAVDQLLDIKREGAGLGQVPQSQLELLQTLLGQLDVQSQPLILRRNLENVIDIYDNVLRLADPEDLEVLGRRLGQPRNRQGGRQEEERIDFEFQNGALVPRGQ